jgi:hypothetical protein
MKDCIRRPSPPASTMGQMLELLLMFGFPCLPPSTACPEAMIGQLL